MARTGLAHPDIYLERLSRPLQEKLKVLKFFPPHSSQILDVGCADGTVTRAIASVFTKSKVTGIDLNAGFINRGKSKSRGISNLKFEVVYLRELLARPERYSVILFCSVLHEFYTYGQGISSVLKALADAHELLLPGGRIIIRDMILEDYTLGSNLHVAGMLHKIRRRPYLSRLHDFEKVFGPIKDTNSLNHFLLKYMYTENWKHECPENYIPVTSSQYEAIFSLLGMRVQHKHSYLIDYLYRKWMDDFKLTPDEMSDLKSTAIFVAQKV